MTVVSAVTVDRRVVAASVFSVPIWYDQPGPAVPNSPSQGTRAQGLRGGQAGQVRDRDSRRSRPTRTPEQEPSVLEGARKPPFSPAGA